jgi:hypothetical protein
MVNNKNVTTSPIDSPGTHIKPVYLGINLSMLMLIASYVSNEGTVSSSTRKSCNIEFATKTILL